MIHISIDDSFLPYFILRASRLGANISIRGGVIHCPRAELTVTAAALADCLLDRYEPLLLRQLLDRRYACYDDAERRQLLARLTLLIAEDAAHGCPYIGGARRTLLAARIAAQLEQTPRFDLGGFCRFGLSGWREYLLSRLALAADELVAEQEEAACYQQLKRLCAAREGRDELHLFFNAAGYDLCRRDEQGLHSLEGGRVACYEELLLATLLQLAPARLIVHSAEYAAQPLLALLDYLFEGRLIIG
ncbi:MAG: sporulation protein YtxC [Bacillota bacterium]|nr:sporulation protein YtxC [Bacillota bacterium]